MIHTEDFYVLSAASIKGLQIFIILKTSPLSIIYNIHHRTLHFLQSTSIKMHKWSISSVREKDVTLIY